MIWGGVLGDRGWQHSPRTPSPSRRGHTKRRWEGARDLKIVFGPVLALDPCQRQRFTGMRASLGG